MLNGVKTDVPLRSVKKNPIVRHPRSRITRWSTIVPSGSCVPGTGKPTANPFTGVQLSPRSARPPMLAIAGTLVSATTATTAESDAAALRRFARVERSWRGARQGSLALRTASSAADFAEGSHQARGFAELEMVAFG